MSTVLRAQSSSLNSLPRTPCIRDSPFIWCRGTVPIRSLSLGTVVNRRRRAMCETQASVRTAILGNKMHVLQCTRARGLGTEPSSPRRGELQQQAVATMLAPYIPQPIPLSISLSLFLESLHMYLRKVAHYRIYLGLRGTVVTPESDSRNTHVLSR